MHEAGHPKMVLWDNPEGWGGEGGGWEAQDGGTHVYQWLFHVDVLQNLHNIVIILHLNTIFEKGKKKESKDNEITREPKKGTKDTYEKTTPKPLTKWQ